jgi:hypothetical protein
MPPIVPIRELAVDGMITDVVDYDLKPNQISRAINVRYENKLPIRSPGWEKVNIDWSDYRPYSDPGQPHDGKYFVPISAHEVINATEKGIVIVLGEGVPVTPNVNDITKTPDELIYPENIPQPFSRIDEGGRIKTVRALRFVYYDGSAGKLVDLTGTIDVTDYFEIDKSTYHGAAIFNFQSGAPFVYDSMAKTIRKLENWENDLGADASCQIFTNFKSFYIALNLREGGQHYGNKIRWSHTVEPPVQTGNDPRWVDNDPAYLSGFFYLPDENDEIINAVRLGDRLIIYSKKSCFAMTFTGGPYVFSIQKIFEDDGAASINSVAEYDNSHFVMSDSDFYVHDGNTKKSVVQHKVKKEMFNSIEFSESVYVFKNNAKNELFVTFNVKQDYASNLETPPYQISYVYNADNDGWAILNIPYVNEIITAPPMVFADNVYNALDIEWQNVSRSWEDFGKIQNDPTFYYISEYWGELYRADKTYLQDSVQYKSTISRSNIDLDELFKDSYPIKHVKQLIPLIKGVGLLDFTFSVANSHQEVTNIIQSKEWDLSSAEWKIDTRFSGRYFSYNIEMDGIGNFSINGMDINLETRGRR